MQVFPEGLAEDFLRVARQLRRETSARMPLGLNLHEARALRVIGEAGPLRASELAERLGIAARSATDSVAGLVAGGFVERRPDPADGRAWLLALTDAGHAALDQVARARAAAAARLFGRLSPTEGEQLAALLARLADPSP